MKAIHKHIAFAALTLSAAACSQDDDFAPSYLSDPDAVRITAQVGTNDVTGGFTRSNPLGTAEEQAKFNTGDQIAVAAGSQAAVAYTLADDQWNPAAGQYLKWQTATMDVTAWYPAGKNNASATTFSVPTGYADQAAVADADYMTYSGTQTKGDDKSINLTMQRKMVRLAITPEFNNQFATGYSVTAIKVHANTKGYADGQPEIGDITVTALKQGNAFYALLAPTAEATAATFLTVTVSDGTTSQDLTLKGIPATTAGNSYSFTLMVGKDMVTMGTVSVNDWNGATIGGGEAEVVNIVDATSMTAEELTAAVTKALSVGCTDIEVTMTETPAVEMFTAIRRALIDTESVADGSINLTLKGVTAIPSCQSEVDGSTTFGGNNKTGEWEEVAELNSVTLPDVTSIGDEAFYACSYLTSISAPKVETIGTWALGCTSLTSVDFPELTTIGFAMLSGTYTLTSAKFPEVTTIGAFGLEIRTDAGVTIADNIYLELTAEGEITFADDEYGADHTAHFGSGTLSCSKNINLVLNADKKDAVTENTDGTATWQISEDLSYTFKSITFVGEVATE